MAANITNAAKKIAEKKGFKVITAAEVAPFEYVGCGIANLDELGGAVRGRYDVVFGPEGCGKSTLIARRIAWAQRKWPDRDCLLAASENRVVVPWFTAQGVDPARLLVLDDKAFEKATMEAYFDAMIALIREEIVSYSAIDSISAMTPRDVIMTSKEQERSVEENQVAADAKKIQQWIKMSKGDLYRTDTACTIIAQVRTHGIGGAMTWEDFSGGHMLRHMATQIWQGRRAGKSEWEKEKVKIDGKDVEVVKSFLTEWTLKKDTGPNESRKAFVRFVAGVGFDDFETHIRAGIRLGTIKNPAVGSFTLVTKDGEEKKIRGVEKVFEFYRDEAEFEVLKKRNLEVHAAAEAVEEKEE